MMERFAPYGTFFMIGRGVSFALQRFGVGEQDNRTSFFYGIKREDGDAKIFEEIGITEPNSRESGIITDGDRLQKIREFLHRDMGDYFDPVYHQVIDALDRVTVRGVYVHGESTTLRKEVSLPLICIGDSMRNCGLGGGGILAMRDALDTAEILSQPGAFDPESCKVNLEPLRVVENVMMERKVEFNAGRASKPWSQDRPHGDPIMTLGDLLPSTSILLKLVFRSGIAFFRAWFQLARWFGRPGSNISSPIYPSVRPLL